MIASWHESYDKPKQCIKKQRHHFVDKGSYHQGYVFSSSHIRLWELDHKEGRVPKNWCFWTVVLEKTLERPLDCKEIQPVHPKGNQPWILIGRTNAETEAPILIQTANSLEKTLMLGKTEGRRGWQRTWLLDGITDAKDKNSGKLWEFVRGREARHAAVHWVAKRQTQLGDWTTTTYQYIGINFPKFFIINVWPKSLETIELIVQNSLPNTMRKGPNFQEIVLFFFLDQEAFIAFLFAKAH